MTGEHRESMDLVFLDPPTAPSDQSGRCMRLVHSSRQLATRRQSMPRHKRAACLSTRSLPHGGVEILPIGDSHGASMKRGYWRPAWSLERGRDDPWRKWRASKGSLTIIARKTLAPPRRLEPCLPHQMGYLFTQNDRYRFHMAPLRKHGAGGGGDEASREHMVRVLNFW